MPITQNEYDLIMGALKDIKEDTKKLTKCMFEGNGKPAVMTRLDRIEVRDERRSKLNWIIITALVGVCITGMVAIGVSFAKRTTMMEQQLSQACKSISPADTTK